MGVKTPDVFKTQAKTNLCLAGAAEGPETRGDGPQTRKNVYFAGPLGTLGTLENTCVACFADIATLCQNTCFLQVKGVPSIIPSMGRFGTVTSVGAKLCAKMRTTIPS